MHNVSGNFKKIVYLLTTKVILLCIVIVLPLNIALIFLTQRMMERVDEQVQLSLQNIADVYMSSLNTRMQQTDYYFYSRITENVNYISLRTAKDELTYINARFRCFQDMADEMTLTSNCDVCFVYIEEKEDYIVNERVKNTGNLNMFKAYLKDNMEITKNWTVKNIEDTPYLIHITKWSNVYYGAFINLEDAANEVGKSVSFTNKIINFVSEGQNEQLNDYVSVVSASDRTDMELMIQVSRAEIRDTLAVWEQGQVAISILFIGLLPALYLAIKKWILKPLKELNAAHHELEVGNEDFRIQNQGSSYEFHEAYHSFNEMADNIHSLKLENMEKELARKQLQLTNLQLQVRPHFLLNTFNLIFNLATEKKTDSIKELVLYLSSYFRHIFRSGKELELFAKELELIEGYVKAAMIRYPDTLQMTYQIDPDVYMVRIPPLLVHNFIENIVNHAMVKNQTLHMMLSAEYVDRQVTFMISDDGIGMSEEEVELINHEKYFEDGQRVHVGLRNSATRLKYFYGEEAAIRVESELGSGTLFIISFPYNLEEEE